MSPLIAEVQIRKAIAIVTVTTEDGDGGDAPIELPVDTAVLHHLRKGVHLPSEAWAEIVAEGRRLLAVRRALEALARRHRTERELRTLLAKSFDQPAVDHAIARMREAGYLDDGAWAKRYVASSRASSRGGALLRRELSRHVDAGAAAAAIEEHDDEGAARAAARKRLPSLRRVEEPSRSRRLYDFLRRRGFDDELVRRVTAEVLAEAETPASS